MKIVGFIKELDNYSWASSLKDELGETINSRELVGRLVSYLEKGKLVMGWMGYFIDWETKEHIEPHAYWSDGNWIWPSYYGYYLKKYPNFKLNEEFMDSLQKKDFRESSAPFDELGLQKVLIEKMKEK